MNDIQALVGAALGWLLSDGIYVDMQDREDVLQAGYVGALEAATRWVPELGAWSTHVTNGAWGGMMDYIRTELRDGIGSRDSEPLARYGEGDVTDLDELAGERQSLGERQVYEWTPQGFDPEVEAEAMMVVRAVDALPAPERGLVKSAFGLGVEKESMAEIAEASGTSRMNVWRRVNAAMTRLGYRESVAPEGWAEYREEAFRRGAGATKASQPQGILAGKPYRTGRNDLWDPAEAAITRASNKRALALLAKTEAAIILLSNAQ